MMSTAYKTPTSGDTDAFLEAKKQLDKVVGEMRFRTAARDEVREATTAYARAAKPFVAPALPRRF